MDQITRFAIDNSRLTILVLAAITIVGIQTFLTMPSQEDPEIKIRNAQVTVHYPGLSTKLMEDLIARKLEKKIKQIPEVEEVKTTIKTGYVLVSPKVHDRYFDLEPIWQDLRNKMKDIKSELPQDAIGPIVNDDYGRVAAATIALYGRGFDLREIRDVASNLQDEIALMDSVSKVEVFGSQDEYIYIAINPIRLSYYSLSVNELAKALKEQNIVLPGGTIDAGGSDIAIEPSGNFQSVEDIRNVQIKVKDTEQTVYLRDIAEIRRAYIDPPQYPSYFNNRPSIILSVSMIPNYNIEDFGEQISTKVAALQQTLPIGLQMEFATYQPALVKKAVSAAVSNLYQTIAVVLAVVIIFLGVRTGLIVGAIVPLTILMSLIAMNFWGVALQRMSIAAIIIALGLLVDNGIVIAEDIKRRMDSGTAKRDAACEAARTLGLPLLTSSLTTILAFLPLVMSENVTSEFLGSLSQVIITTLLSSWFLALFATPVLCYWFLPDKKPEETQTQKKEDKKSIYTLYPEFLRLVIRFRMPFVLAMSGILIVSILSFGLVTQQMMPFSDRNQFLVYVDLPAGTDVSETIAATRKLTSWLSDKEHNPEITGNIAYVGFGGPRFFLALSPPNPGNNVAFVVVNTQTTDQVKPLLDRVNRFIFEELPQASGRAKAMWLASSEIGLVEYRFIGPDEKVLYSLSRQMEQKMRSVKGSLGVLNDWQNPVLRIKVEIDQTRAARAGVSSTTIARALSGYFDGYEISAFREGDKTIPIVLRGDKQRHLLSKLFTLPILSEKGVPVPLLQVADFDSSVEPHKIVRKNQKRTLTVSGKHRWLQAAEFHALLLDDVNSLDLPEGYQIEFGGEVESAADSNGALFANMPLALAGIAILLIWQFNSIRRAGIILLTIPLVLIGAAIGLLVMNAFLSFTAILGVFSLAGIIVNNGIVLIDRIDIERRSVADVHQAIINACSARVRPILMTTLTTILGLVPLALFGGELWYPMAIVIMFGLAVGTLLTLAFVPALYALFFKQTSFNQTSFNQTGAQTA